ncbi:hypothetical protein [Halobacillus seohaensis]|uniref:Uncharacterized protein n=1 Tax=Halobacillus seohaensis TaxID=447421 RepID=A0ABW2EJT9_9BACI
MSDTNNPRRWIYSVNSYSSNILHYQNPWICVWWSLAFPGFGHLTNNNFLWGMVLITFEFSVNNLGNINGAIFFSMIGEIEQAKLVLEYKWVHLYVMVYIFSAWDIYWRCVESNKAYKLAYSEQSKIKNFQMSPFELNLLSRKKPWVAFIWSMLLPGLGHYYLHRIPISIFAFIWVFIVLIYSNVYEGVYYSMTDDIEKSKSIMNPQWILFIPSLHLFAMYDSYRIAVSNNKIFNIEQSTFLKEQYQLGSLNSIYNTE